jgi:hypothetical protein
MREFSRPGGFDLILSMWTSFGYFDDPEDDLSVLEHCHANLRDGGALLIDVVGKEIIVRDIKPVHLTEFDDGALLIERPVLQANMTRYSNEWILVRGEHAWRAEWHHNLYAASELEGLMVEAGFGEVAIFGSLDGDEYDMESDRLIMVGWK